MLLEKPPAATVQEIDAMLAASLAKGEAPPADSRAASDVMNFAMDRLLNEPAPPPPPSVGAS